MFSLSEGALRNAFSLRARDHAAAEIRNAAATKRARSRGSSKGKAAVVKRLLNLFAKKKVVPGTVTVREDTPDPREDKPLPDVVVVVHDDAKVKSGGLDLGPLEEVAQEASKSSVRGEVCVGVFNSSQCQEQAQGSREEGVLRPQRVCRGDGKGMGELHDICRYIRAKSFKIVVENEAKVEHSRELLAALATPLLDPSSMATGASAGTMNAGPEGGRREAVAQSTTRENLVMVEFEQPNVDEDMLPVAEVPNGWYFYKQKEGHHPELRKFITTNLDGQDRELKLELEFAVEDMSRTETGLAASVVSRVVAPNNFRNPVSQVGGVGFKKQNREFDENRMRYAVTIEMWDKEVYDKMKRLSQNELTRAKERVRRVSESVGTMRWRNFRLQPHIRLDLQLAGEDRVPSDQSNLMPRKNFVGFEMEGEFERGEAEEPYTNYVDIPVVLYGPEGVNTREVLATWEHGSINSPYTFLIQTHEDYANDVNGGYYRSPEFLGDIGFFAKDIGRGAEGFEIVESRRAYHGKLDCARLRIKATVPTTTYKEDGDGVLLPDMGLQVLVLDADRVAEVVDADDVEVALEGTGWSKLLGLEVQHVSGKVKVYPPLACIVAGTNRLGGDTEERPIFERRAEAMLKEQLGLSHVFFMETFPIPSAEEVREYREAPVLSELRLAAKKKWRATSLSAVGALEGVMRAILTVEQASVANFLRAEKGYIPRWYESSLLRLHDPAHTWKMFK
ncbi:unnamed protein product [Durusdinium trenchii]|uniref:Uncharacterized protein n=1 Tax=Durusdinium trenchii TaxID=1381693 RepID=A0ABP0NHH5_9DINO